ncbi:MAG: hypothetical protein AAFR38_05650 [Planctomycetota bacterium]
MSPVGIGLRDLEYARTPPGEPAVYKADWMGEEPEDYLEVFTPEGGYAEPWVFRMPPGWTRPARGSWGPRSSAFLEHPNGARVLTGATFHVVGGVSASVGSVGSVANFRFVEGDAPLIELTFDGHAQGETLDFRPESPVVIRY